MGKTSKYVTAAALCSTIVMGAYTSSVSYAATNPTVATTQSDAKLLNDFRTELKTD